jgi:hypothetical protein
MWHSRSRLNGSRDFIHTSASILKEGNMSENPASSVASVAIVVIILLAIFAFYLLFGRGVQANREINIDINRPKHDVPNYKR